MNTQLNKAIDSKMISTIGSAQMPGGLFLRMQKAKDWNITALYQMVQNVLKDCTTSRM